MKAFKKLKTAHIIIYNLISNCFHKLFIKFIQVVDRKIFPNDNKIVTTKNMNRHFGTNNLFTISFSMHWTESRLANKVKNNIKKMIDNTRKIRTEKFHFELIKIHF